MSACPWQTSRNCWSMCRHAWPHPLPKVRHLTLPFLSFPYCFIMLQYSWWRCNRPLPLFEQDFERCRIAKNREECPSWESSFDTSKSQHCRAVMPDSEGISKPLLPAGHVKIKSLRKRQLLLQQIGQSYSILSSVRPPSMLTRLR